MKRQEKGITLIALIITIIILLILAVVSISAVTGSGLFTKTNEAVDTYQNSVAKENIIMDDHIEILDNYLQYAQEAKAYGTESQLYIIWGNKAAFFVDGVLDGLLTDVKYTKNYELIPGNSTAEIRNAPHPHEGSISTGILLSLTTSLEI